MFDNIPVVKLGLIAVSRDCFPVKLSETRRSNIAKEFRNLCEPSLTE